MSEESGRMPAAPSTVRDLVDFAHRHSAAALEARLAPLLLVGPPTNTDPDWAYRTASLNLVRETINGQELVFDASFVVHPLKKLRPGPFASTVLIGRSGSNDVCILHGSVSKLHARAALQPDGTWLLSDAGSSNGTVVQGKVLAARETRTLTPGMLIAIGACHFTVVDAVRFHEILLRLDNP